VVYTVALEPSSANGVQHPTPSQQRLLDRSLLAPGSDGAAIHPSRAFRTSHHSGDDTPDPTAFGGLIAASGNHVLDVPADREVALLTAVASVEPASRHGSK
jgi:hypothetical protein